jgi:hypothetical protein
VLTVECPKCQRKLDVPDQLANEDLYCYSCDLSLNDVDREGRRDAQRKRREPTVARRRVAAFGVLVGMAAAPLLTLLGPVGQVAAGMVAGAGVGAVMGGFGGLVHGIFRVFLLRADPAQMVRNAIAIAVLFAVLCAIGFGMSAASQKSVEDADRLFAACGGSVIGGLSGWFLSKRR